MKKGEGDNIKQITSLKIRYLIYIHIKTTQWQNLGQTSIISLNINGDNLSF